MTRPIDSNTSINSEEAGKLGSQELSRFNQEIINNNFANDIIADKTNYMLYTPNSRKVYDAPRHAENVNNVLNDFYKKTIETYNKLIGNNPNQAQEYLANRLGFLQKVTDQSDPNSALNQSGLQNVMVTGNDGKLHKNFGSAQVDNLKSLSDLWTKKNLELSELAKPISPSQQGSESVVGQGSSTLGSQSSSPSSSLFLTSSLLGNNPNQAQIYLGNNTNQYDPNLALYQSDLQDVSPPLRFVVNPPLRFVVNPPLQFVPMPPNHVVASKKEPQPQYHPKTSVTTTRTDPQLSASQNTHPIGQTGLADNNQNSKANGPTHMPRVLNVTKPKEHVDPNTPAPKIINFNPNTPKVLKVEPIDRELLEKVKLALLNKNNLTSLTTSPRIHPRSPSGGSQL